MSVLSVEFLWTKLKVWALWVCVSGVEYKLLLGTALHVSQSCEVMLQITVLQDVGLVVLSAAGL